MFNINAPKNRGMTFLEVIVSLVLLSLIAVMFLPIFVTTTVWIRKAGDDSAAATYVNSIMEEIRTNRNVIYDTAGTPTTPTALNITSTTAPASLSNLNASIEMTPDASLINIYMVTVTASWTKNGQNRSFTQKATIRKDTGA